MTEIHDPEQNTDERQLNEIAKSVGKLLRSYDTVAYVLGVKQGRTVKNWAEQKAIPTDRLMETKLRVTEKLALAVKDEQRPWISGAWLLACNPYLGEVAPMRVIQSIGTDEYPDSMLACAEQAATLFAEFDV